MQGNSLIYLNDIRRQYEKIVPDSDAWHQTTPIFQILPCNLNQQHWLKGAPSYSNPHVSKHCQNRMAMGNNTRENNPNSPNDPLDSGVPSVNDCSINKHNSEQQLLGSTKGTTKEHGSIVSVFSFDTFFCVFIVVAVVIVIVAFYEGKHCHRIATALLVHADVFKDSFNHVQAKLIRLLFLTQNQCSKRVLNCNIQQEKNRHLGSLDWSAKMLLSIGCDSVDRR